MKDNEDDNFSLREALKDMAENTTLHGVPKIVSAKRVHMKILWAILFVGLSGYLTFSLYQLFQRYYSWPIQTTVSLEFGNLKFPSVSFCNVNPIKKSRVGETSQQLRQILKITDTINDNAATGPPTDYPANSQTDPLNQAGISTTISQLLPLNKAGASTTNTQTSQHNQPSSSAAVAHTDPGSILGSGDAMNDSDIDAPSDWNYWDIEYTPATPPDYSILEELDPGLASILVLQKDEWFKRVQDFKAAFSNESKELRKRIGHSIEDMLISCSFEGRKCDMKGFFPFQSNEFGNCYSLDNGFTSVRSGPTYGLWLTLNLEVPEYIKNYASGYGIKLVIHEPATYAFPSDEGLIISPGQETIIGLRMVQVNRIQTPNKYCEKGEDFQAQYGIKFTMTACIQLCKQTLILERCGCMPSGIEIEIPSTNKNILNAQRRSVCDPEDFQQTLCQIRIDNEYNEGTLSCDCNSPCHEVIYQKTLSGRNWPNDDYLKYGLLRDLCHDSNLTYMEDACTALEVQKDAYSPTEIKDNFIRVVIFYEDLNYETITEEPMYDSFRFISDVGGTMGLFVGASLLSFFELIQLFVVMCTYVRERLSGKNRVTKVKTSREFKSDVRRIGFD